MGLDLNDKDLFKFNMSMIHSSSAAFDSLHFIFDGLMVVAFHSRFRPCD